MCAILQLKFLCAVAMKWLFLEIFLRVSSVFAGRAKNFEQVYVGLNNRTAPRELRPSSTTLDVGDVYGHAVAVWDDIALVSANKKELVNTEVGEYGLVFVFERDERRIWKDTGLILASWTPGDGFGNSLSIWDNIAVVGAPFDEDSSGNVYVASSGTRLLSDMRQLRPSVHERGCFFGFSVAIVGGSGEYSHGAVIVGAYRHSFNSDLKESGSVFVFSVNGGEWIERFILEPSSPSAHGHFGWSVAGSGNAIIVGAPGQESAFLFHLEYIAYECPIDGEWYREHPRDRVLGGEPQQGREGEQQHQDQQHPDYSSDQYNECWTDPDDDPAGKEEEERREEHHLRRMQGPPDDQRHQTRFYHLWSYREVLHIQNDLMNHRGDLFGFSVAVSNHSAALTLAVGSPLHSDLGSARGAVMVMTLLPRSDVYSTWNPHNSRYSGMRRASIHLSEDPNHGNNQDQHEHEHENENEERNNNNRDDGEGDSSSSLAGRWYIRSSQYAEDLDGQYWRRTEFVGDQTNGQYGYAIAIGTNEILVGSFSPVDSIGHVQIVSLTSSDKEGVVEADVSPVFRGPLLGLDWRSTGSLVDSKGNEGDLFGSAVALHETTAVVGGLLTGYRSTTSIGSGAAYVFDGASERIEMSMTKDVFVVLIVCLVLVALYQALPVRLPHLSPKTITPSLDSSLSSVDTIDANSSHPLTREHRAVRPSPPLSSSHRDRPYLPATTPPQAQQSSRRYDSHAKPTAPRASRPSDSDNEYNTNSHRPYPSSHPPSASSPRSRPPRQPDRAPTRGRDSETDRDMHDSGEDEEEGEGEGDVGAMRGVEMGGLSRGSGKYARR
jgi:hypothetical protein